MFRAYHHRDDALLGVRGLVGESGSGKTMSFLALMGLLPPGARVSGEKNDYTRELLSAVPELPRA